MAAPDTTVGSDPPGQDPIDEQLRRIEIVTDFELASLELPELLDALLQRVRELLDVDTAAVLLLTPQRTHVVATAALGIDEEVQQGVRIPLGRGFAGRIAAERAPVILDDVTTANVQNPLLLTRGIRSLLGVPLIASGDLLGVLHVGTLTRHLFTEDDAKLLQLVADRVALATQARISRSDRTAVHALQRSLLPSELPAIEGWDVAARYVPGDGGVGGDWYDVFRMPDGRLCIIVGDVAGQGLPAAVTMGRLRTVCRANALAAIDPAALLSLVDQHISYFEPTTMATVLCAVLEPSTGALSMSTAGHPPPVLALPSGATALLDVPADLPLGVDDTCPRRVTRVVVAPGSSLCLYTDGLVERRDSDLDSGFERLCDAMGAAPAEAVCAMVMAAMVGRQQAHDDIAVLALTFHDGQDTTEGPGACAPGPGSVTYSLS
jgi:serine phosphatase RsbU (regulator of sigma subunit)